MDLVGYLSNGYPSNAETVRMASAYIQRGCDILEIDFPSKNPYIEGDLLKKE